MIWYLLNILMITFTWLWPVDVITTEKNILKKNYKTYIIRKKRVCVIATLNWITLSGLRGLEIGADTLAYKEYFNETIFFRGESVFLRFI